MNFTVRGLVYACVCSLFTMLYTCIESALLADIFRYVAMGCVCEFDGHLKPTLMDAEVNEKSLLSHAKPGTFFPLGHKTAIVPLLVVSTLVCLYFVFDSRLFGSAFFCCWSKNFYDQKMRWKAFSCASHFAIFETFSLRIRFFSNNFHFFSQTIFSFFLSPWKENNHFLSVIINTHFQTQNDFCFVFVGFVFCSVLFRNDEHTIAHGINAVDCLEMKEKHLI